MVILFYLIFITMSKKKKDDAWGENGFEDWGGYMAAKQAKLEEQFRNVANKEFKHASNLFNGIAIFVNGYTDPTADELRRLMMEYGGIYHHYMRPGATTHIIASNLPYSKIVMYRKSQHPIPICKPQWITDSIMAGRILNIQNYLLYSNCTNMQPQLKYKIEATKTRTNVEFDIHDKMQTDNMSKNDNDKKSEIIKSISTNQDNTNVPVVLNSRDVLSTKNSEFLSEFYNHSRLHHISTMGATFKEYVNELRDKGNGKFPGLTRLKELRDIKLTRSLSDTQSSFNNEMLYLQEENKTEINEESIIMHIDMDCFFVSVGLRDKPELKGLPVAVTHAKGNKRSASSSKEVSSNNENENDEHGSMSEIASCSYEARKAGVKNGMFLGEALKICPNLKTITYDFEGYREVSYTLYDTVASYTLDIEAVSCDEMYANCALILHESCLTPIEFAAVIRQEIKKKTGCPVSTGFGNNKLLARLATRKAKPDGQYYIKPEHVKTFIGTFNVQDLPGVGWTTTQKLNSINVHTCAELQAISLTMLQKTFGKKMGEMLYNMGRGIDNSKLNLEHVRKSVSAEVNYGIRFESNKDAIDFLKKLSEEVCNRLKNINARGRCITLKLLVRSKEAPKESAKFMGHGLCDYITKSKNLIAAIDDVDIITKEIITLWNQIQKVPEDARGIGIQITRLEILKNKSRDTRLTSFINKNKQCDKINRSSETQSSVHPNSIAFVHESVILDNQQKIRVPTSVVPSEFSEKIQTKILDFNENKNYITVTNNEKQSNSSALEVNEKKSEKCIQTLHENFFKQTKPGISRSTKVEMPPIEDIDMAVLIELPEDIRNEILNEYSVKKNQNRLNININRDDNCASSICTSDITKLRRNEEQNISFSQVDPEFLAALSEDLRHDVQMYCKAKKAERYPKIKEDETLRNRGEARVKNITKESKKIERISKTKNNSKNSKITCFKHNRKKGIQAAFKSIENKDERESTSDKKISNSVSNPIIPCLKRNESDESRISADETAAILSHNRTITEDNESAIGHQDILIDLVNRLLNLPLEQVKMQIKIWVTNSKIVNEVDFLSLATFLSMLPVKKRIEDLHVLLKTMHRCMTKTGNCIWHRTYRKTVKYVQHYMQIEYNSNLMVPSIKCNLLQCNNDVM
ncbi:DNA repair protein REV1 isoform X2 [Colletes gigas]|uniref:DNA repair protein REV1 isoform X2 n=1 Tax=Colletes gigas TaxID=935657 RepID=UPI001C9B4F08|nr:DNA repair protein REV1 isoform X2 [Colletes gigas]